jgi:hypothetical protein
VHWDLELWRDATLALTQGIVTPSVIEQSGAD